MPSLVTYNKTSYETDAEIGDETEIGPEVTHIYQVQSFLRSFDSIMN